MADNSFRLKGWCVTVVIITFIFRAKVDSLIICFIPLMVFGFLDSYYLALEQSFRMLYKNKVADFKQNNLENIFVLDRNKVSICQIFKVFISPSILIFYLGIAILILIAYYLKG